MHEVTRLLAELVDVPDGSIWAGNPTIGGNISTPWNFSIGTHSLTLTAVDSDTNRASKTVNFEVIDGGAPTIAIQSPADGSAYDGGLPISFSATVGDDLTPVENLTVEWSSDLQGVLSTAPPDSFGNVAFTSTGLIGGTHTITLAVTNPLARPIEVDARAWTEPEPWLVDGEPFVSRTAIDAFNPFTTDTRTAYRIEPVPAFEVAPGETARRPLRFSWPRATSPVAPPTFVVRERLDRKSTRLNSSHSSVSRMPSSA